MKHENEYNFTSAFDFNVGFTVDGGSRTVQNSTDPHLKTATYPEIIKKNALQDMMCFVFFCLFQLSHLKHLTI